MAGASAAASAAAGRSLLHAALAAAAAASPVQAMSNTAAFPKRKAASADGAGDDPEGSPKEGEQEEEEAEERHLAGWELLRAALGWQQLVSPSRRDGGADGGQGSPPPGADPERWARERAFDIADSLEGGMARETATDFTTPLRRSSRLWRFRVLRSEDRQRARLVTDAGDFLMFSQVSLKDQRISFFLYDPDDRRGLYDPSAPAFSMGYNKARTEWRLVQERCDNCRLAPPHLSCTRLGRQQLAYVRHFRQTIGEGISNCMEVIIPGIYTDHTAVVWCPMLGRKDLGLLRNDRGRETQHLVTAEPVWNDEVGSLVLDFKGRNIIASAKNFQLALQQRPDQVLCQYGKLGPTSFGLDFKYPLNAAQAFAVAMSTIFWT